MFAKNHPRKFDFRTLLKDHDDQQPYESELYGFVTFFLFFFLTMFKITFVRVTYSTFQKALSHKNNLIKVFFSLSFPEDEVTGGQEIIDVSLPV